MKSYALEKYGLSRGGLICGNIVMMRKKMYNQIGSIKPAPYRFSLKEFGVDLTIEEFRKNNTVDLEKPKDVKRVSSCKQFIYPLFQTQKRWMK